MTHTVHGELGGLARDGGRGKADNDKLAAAAEVKLLNILRVCRYENVYGTVSLSTSRSAVDVLFPFPPLTRIRFRICTTDERNPFRHEMNYEGCPEQK